MRFAFSAALLVALLVSTSTSAQRGRRRDASTPVVEQTGDQYRDHPRCIEVRAEPVFNGVGWNHVVIVRNECTRRYECQISTNVDPAPAYPVVLDPGEQRAVATRNGSPASGFSPKAVCR